MSLVSYLRMGMEMVHGCAKMAADRHTEFGVWGRFYQTTLGFVYICILATMWMRILSVCTLPPYVMLNWSARIITYKTFMPASPGVVRYMGDTARTLHAGPGMFRLSVQAG